MVLEGGGGGLEGESDQKTLCGLFKELINMCFEVDTVQMHDAKKKFGWVGLEERRGKEVCYVLGSG